MTPDRLFIALGLVIRRYREDHKFTQEAFANAHGMSQSYYGKVERGDHNLTLWNFARIAEGLGLPASKLLRDAEGLDIERALKRGPRPPSRGRPIGSGRKRPIPR
jgi:transcriptional regulator with XRE-family HTH domain